MSDNTPKQVTPQSGGAKPAPKLTKPIMPVPQLAKTQAQVQQGQFDFTKVHVHFAVPCYGGMVSEPTMTSFLRFTLLASKVGLNWSLDTMVNESLVTRARNNLCAKMMTNAQATHFMFIDADITFSWISIVRLLISGKELCGGCYPKKVFNWDKIKASIALRALS